MQEKITNLSGRDRAILDQYADFRLSDQMQSIFQNGVEPAMVNRNEMASILSASRQLAGKKK